MHTSSPRFYFDSNILKCLNGARYENKLTLILPFRTMPQLRLLFDVFDPHHKADKTEKVFLR